MIKVIIELDELDNSREYSKSKILLNKLHNDNPDISVEIKGKSKKYKHGDILHCIDDNAICIFNKYSDNNEKYINCICHYLYNDGKYILISNNDYIADKFRLATDEEKQILFKQLAKDGKRWNEETCEIEELKWKPKNNEKYYYPTMWERKGMFITVNDTWDNINIDNDRFTNWHLFKTEEECQKKCDELNEKIKK